MFTHRHPYPPFIPENATKLIVGTLPPPRFSTGELKPGDVDFNYGSRDGQLWLILDRIFQVGFSYETSQKAIDERRRFLRRHKIGISDMVACAYREKIDASDRGIKQVELRDLIGIIKHHPQIQTLLFTGGNSKGGPEYFFRKHLKDYPDISLKREGTSQPKIHHFSLGNRRIQTVSLTAPSGAANRAVGSKELYKKMKRKYPNFTTVDFRILQYKPFFKN